MRMAAGLLVSWFALLAMAAEEEVASDTLRVFVLAGGNCTAMAEDLRKREAELDAQASILESESGAISPGSDDDDAGEQAPIALDDESAAEMLEIDEELERLEKLAEFNQGTPVYMNLLDSIKHLKGRKQRLTNEALRLRNEDADRQNVEIEAENGRIEAINARIAAYNARTLEFEEDVSRFKARCSGN